MASKTDNEGPIYLWQPEHPEWGWLSQWYQREFHAEDEKVVYNTAEQYMMEQKATFFKDDETAKKIMNTRDPGKQKALGREVKNFDAEKWNTVRDRIVENGSYHKFKYDEDMKSRLLETGDRELVEASPRDRIWGVGFDEKDAEGSREHWGLNLLGKALTRARQRIREEEGKETTL